MKIEEDYSVLVTEWEISTSGNLNQMNFNIETEDNVTTDINHCVEYKGALMEQSTISNESYDQKFFEGNVRADSLHVEYWKIDSKIENEMDFKIDIEENAKIEIDNYQKASQKQLVENEENIQMVDVKRMDGSEKNFKWMPTARQNNFKCQICQFSTNYFSSVKLHEKKHEKLSKFFICGVCHKAQDTAHQLKYHLFTHLKEAERIRVVDSTKTCDIFSAKIKVIAEINGKKHELDVYKCEECDYSSSYLSAIQNHAKGLDLYQKDFE